MRNSRITVIVGLLVIMVLFGFSHYDKKTSMPKTSNKQTTVKSTSPNADTTSTNPAAVIDQAKKEGMSMWLLFYSATCPSCIEMHQIFNQLKSEYQNKIKFIEIDVDEPANAELNQAWKIQLIPTTFIINSQGEISYHNMGVIPVEDLKKELNKVVK